MTLNSTGPLSIGGSTTGQSINLELGRSATASSNLNETDLRNLAGISSGAISISSFYGKTNATITLNSSYTVSDYDVLAAYAAIKFKTDGNIDEQTGGGGTQDIGDWISPTTAAPGSYEIRASGISGAGGTFTGTLNTWQALSTQRDWSLSVSGTGNSGTRSFTIEIRIGTNVLDSCTVTLYAEAL